MTTSPAQITDELLDELGSVLTDHRELNTSNYGHDDVCQLNNWAIGACETLERADLHIRSLTERLEHPPQWISVEDNLPGFPRPVLVAHHSDDDGEPCLDTGVAMLYPDGKWRGCATFYAMGTPHEFIQRETERSVTHWMPMPAPPAIAQEGADHE